MFFKKAVSNRSSLSAPTFLIMGLWGAFSAPAALAGPFDQVQWVLDDVNGIDHLACATDTATSPDLHFAYVGSFCDKAINTFARDMETGQLNLIQTLLRDEETGTGIQPEDDVLISPDGRHVYVNGHTGKPGVEGNNFRSAIFVFERDPQSGLLSQRQIYDGRGLTSPLTLLMSADGNYLYVGSLNSQSVTVLKRAANGILSEVQFIKALPENRPLSSVHELIFSPSQDTLYVGRTRNNESAISWMKRDAVSGTLTYAGEISSTTPGLASLGSATNFVMSPSGNNLYLLDAGTDTAFMWHFAVNPDASLSFKTEYGLPPASPDSRFYCPVGMSISSNNRLLYFVDHCANSFHLWGINEPDGALTYFGTAKHDASTAMSQVDSVRLTPDERFAHLSTRWGVEVYELTADNDLTLKVPTPVAPGTEFQATLEALNLGTATAHSVTITTELSPGVEFVSAAPSSNTTDCNATQGKVVCAIGTVPDGALEEVILTLRLVDATANPTLTATLTQDEIDPNESNNSQTVALNSEGTDTSPVPGDTAPVTEESGKSNGGGGSFDSGLLLIFGALGLLSLVLTRRSLR